MPLLDHFSIIAPFYDRAMPLKHADSLIAHTGLPTAGALLDAGGGTGRVAHAIRHLVGEAIVVDISMGMLRQAQKKDSLQPACAHSECLPFRSDSFERIIMIDALHHVCDQQETADELWRLLKPGGRLVIEEPDLRTLTVKLLAMGEKLLLMRSHFLSPGQIAALFKHPDAQLEIQADGFNAWVIVEKAVSVMV